jgi:SNF2 family DNA or RNA helicase
VVRGYRDLDELAARIDPYTFKATLEDCYDLPPSQYAFREVELTPEQRRLYKELKDYATVQLSSGEHVTATVVIALIIRLHQVLCGHVRDENGAWHDVPERRTAALLEELEEYDGKAIIWCAYTRDVEKVSAALRKAYGTDSVARFYGGNNSSREQEEEAFKTSSSCRWMVATAAAGGRGRTWDMADLSIFHSNSDNLEHRLQAEERPKNVGKTRSVSYVDLIVPNTVETKIIKSLREKIDLSTAVMQGDPMDWLV